MAQFLTEAELREEFGAAVIDRLVTTLGGSETRVAVAIGDAEDEALSYLRGHSGVPGAPEETSRRLKVLVADLALYNLYRGMNSTPFRVRDGRDNAIAGLRNIQSGELSIAKAADASRSLSLPAVAVVQRGPREDERITLASMRDWGRRP